MKDLQVKSLSSDLEAIRKGKLSPFGLSYVSDGTDGRNLIKKMPISKPAEPVSQGGEVT